MNIERLSKLQVLVLGLGDSGLAMARWCARHGSVVSVWDSRPGAPRDAELARQVPTARRLHGELHAEALDGVQLVLKSPGLAPGDARIAAVLARARATGIALQSELDLFGEALAALKAERAYAPKVIAITGTNGKTTTTAMTALLVERAGWHVIAAGNIGPTMLQSLADELDAGQVVLPDVWVLELSSFQLDGVQGFEPDAAALLNVTQDHLDWHGSFEAYAAAKARVFGKQAVVVVNRDDAQVEALASALVAAPSSAAKRGGEVKAPEHRSKVPALKRASRIERRLVRFGAGAPRCPGDFGIVHEQGMAWLARARETELDGGKQPGPGDPSPELVIQRLMPVDALHVRGRHNALNALAALALGHAVGSALAPMLHALREYRGEPHRVQLVATIDGIDAFDDSKGTNVGATIAALEGLGADRAPAKLVVILGGDGKGQDFTPLDTPLARHARAIATIGRDAASIEEQIQSAIRAAGITLQRHDTLEAATRWCFEQAEEGDAVLLSPACASLDMFDNYAHRASVFVAAAHALQVERTEAHA